VAMENEIGIKCAQMNVKDRTIPFAAEFQPENGPGDYNQCNARNIVTPVTSKTYAPG
jgi:hypothetical protein